MNPICYFFKKMLTMDLFGIPCDQFGVYVVCPCEFCKFLHFPMFKCHGGGIFKDFFITKGNQVVFLSKDLHKYSPNPPYAIQIVRLYNKFTHLTFQWYFHLIFGSFYKMQSSHIDCQGYHEVGHIRLVSCQS